MRTITLIAVATCMHACSIETDGDHKVNVKGGTQHELTIAESFCDRDAYPTAQERRICKDQLLAVWARCEIKEK